MDRPPSPGKEPPPTHRVVTPEAVPITLDVAGLGSRMIASIIDGAIQMVAFLLLALVAANVGLGPTAQLVLVFAGAFLLFWGYFILFEGLWNGRTPGKRAQRLRVIRTDGQPVGWVNVAVRNLLRVVDILPAYYAIGALSMLLTKRSQRLGDLAGGTLVVRERAAKAPAPLRLDEGAHAGPALDASGLDERQYALVRSFLERRASLSAEARSQLAADVAGVIRERVPHEGLRLAGGDERFLEAVALAYRRRFEGP